MANMKKSVYLFSLILVGFLLVGYGPKPYSDLATYKRIPTTTRVDNLLKAGKDLYLRRLYDESRSIFQMVLNLDKDNKDAKFWLSKINYVFDLEKSEKEKQFLYKKYGHLTPIDRIYEGWHWGPEVGHFEVRYSEPKPYVPAVRKFRPKATDAEVKEALQAYEKSKSADDAFELAMRYWSQRKKPEAIKYYFEAADLSSEVLGKDDEYMLSMISEELEEKIEKGNADAKDYLTHGRLALIQGNVNDGVRNLVKSVRLDGKNSPMVKNALDKYLSSGFIDIIGIPIEVYSFRQAYVFDKDKDMVYMRIILCPINNRLLIPVDTTIPIEYIESVTLDSKDALYVFDKEGLGNSTRLWVALPEKENEFADYEVKVIIKLKRNVDESNGIELSNYSLPKEQEDNWSFIISSEFDNAENIIEGNYEKVENGVRVSGYHLGISNGKGPFISFDNFKESLPSDANIWRIIENKEDETNPL